MQAGPQQGTRGRCCQVLCRRGGVVKKGRSIWSDNVAPGLEANTLGLELQTGQRESWNSQPLSGQSPARANWFRPTTFQSCSDLDTQGSASIAFSSSNPKLPFPNSCSFSSLNCQQHQQEPQLLSDPRPPDHQSSNVHRGCLRKVRL